jgi:hypothetical protein
MAMLGIAILIGALAGLFYLVRGRSRPDPSVDASEHRSHASDRARAGNDRSRETGERRPTA